MNLIYVTGNSTKYEIARKFFAGYNIEVLQKKIPIVEIQGDSAIKVATAKAYEAWNVLHQPLFINDASWEIPALKGFPGPYMKYINTWFEPDDFIHLMQGKEDRRIILKDVTVYIDKNGSRVFTHDHIGTILEKKTEIEYRHPSDVVVSFSKNGISIAEEIAKGMFFIGDENIVWKNFAEWFLSQNFT